MTLHFQGTVCEGTDKQRSARVLFECPVDFPVLATHRIVQIEEVTSLKFFTRQTLNGPSKL